MELRIKCQTMDAEYDNIQSLLFDAQLAIEALQVKLNELLLNEHEWQLERESLLAKINDLSQKLSEIDSLHHEIEEIKTK